MPNEFGIFAIKVYALNDTQHLPNCIARTGLEQILDITDEPVDEEDDSDVKRVSVCIKT